MLKYEFNEMLQVREQSIVPENSNSRWLTRGINWENFQIELSELDCLYYNNVNELNQELVNCLDNIVKNHLKKSKQR